MSEGGRSGQESNAESVSGHWAALGDKRAAVDDTERRKAAYSASAWMVGVSEVLAATHTAACLSFLLTLVRALLPSFPFPVLPRCVCRARPAIQ